jgi:PAS domain S-box-containing protein
MALALVGYLVVTASWEDRLARLALLAAATFLVAVRACLPARVPVTFAPAILWAALLASDLGSAVSIAFVSTLVGVLILTRLVHPAAGGLLASFLPGAAVRNPFELERLAAGVVFMVGYWLVELVVLGLVNRWKVAPPSDLVPRSSLIANLLLLVPGLVVADLLLSRGIVFFAPALIVLLAALALIALYLSAETAREEAALERARLQSIVEHAPEGIFAVGPDLSVECLNDSAARLSGWDPAEAVGRLCRDVVQVRRPDGTPVDHAEAFARAARIGATVNVSGALRPTHGEARPVVVSYTAVADRAGSFQVGVGAIHETVVADRMEERAADLGHELRSPLSTILGYARLLASMPVGTIDPANQAEFIARITESGDYMLRLVNNLLDLRRLEAGTEPIELDQLDVESFLLSAILLIKPSADEKRITMTLHVTPGTPPLVTDELLVRRIVDNLLSNAVKYTPRGGSVRVMAERAIDGVAIRISDTGIGLTEEEQARLFERFFRSARPEARRQRGTGLGLALVHEAAKQLGARVQVESEVGVGSRFTLWLPVAPADVVASSAERQKSAVR